jgi:hypothetical protein
MQFLIGTKETMPHIFTVFFIKLKHVRPIVDDHSICSCQIDAQASRTSRQQEAEFCWIGSIESIYPHLPLCTINLAIYSLISPFLETKKKKVKERTNYIHKYISRHTHVQLYCKL